MPFQQGIFTVSLDFELHWGLRDTVSLEECRNRLDGARKTIPALLSAFSAYGIHATWATVGFLFFSDKETLLTGLPGRLPAYRNKQLDPYSAISSIGADEQADPYHYAPSLIKEIAATPGQEVGSHTFSHYYCLEPGQTIETFRADIVAAKRAARMLGLELKSLVFPRNQCNDAYLCVCAESGFSAYRGNPRSWMWSPAGKDRQSAARRLARLSDAYLNLSGRHCHDLSGMTPDHPVDIPASEFLRPYTKALAHLEPLRLRKIKADMTYAAKYRLLYHLWWHPHNFGCDTEENIYFLNAILTHYHYLQSEYGMCSMNMAEVAEKALAPELPLKESA